LQSGVHATIAGVLLAATIPSRATLRTDDFMTGVRELLHELERRASADKYRTTMSKEKQETMKALEATQKEAEAPLYRLEHALQPWIAFAVMPLFALANAGVRLDLGLLTSIVQPVGLGIVLGLVLGKQIGIFLATWLAVKTGLAALPEGLTWPQVYGVGWLAGIGFTMSLFIATLAFQDAQLLLTAKESILLASLLAGLGSWIVFRLVVSAQETERVRRKEPERA
jgi:NhaA family Na+:H+ antiporter